MIYVWKNRYGWRVAAPDREALGYSHREAMRKAHEWQHRFHLTIVRAVKPGYEWPGMEVA